MRGGARKNPKRDATSVKGAAAMSRAVGAVPPVTDRRVIRVPPRSRPGQRPLRPRAALASLEVADRRGHTG